MRKKLKRLNRKVQFSVSPLFYRVRGMQRQFAILFLTILLVALAIPCFGFEVVIQPHTNLYPRVGNPVLTTLPNGSVLSVFTVLNGEYMGVYGKLSDDLHVWTEPFLIKAKTLGYQPFSCAVFVLGTKTFLFYDRFVFWDWNSTDNHCSIWMLESEDNGETWTDDRWIGSENHDYAVGSYSVCQAVNGSWIYPFSWFVPIDGSHSWGSWSCGMLRSDDEGLSWYESGKVPDCPQSLMNLDEPSVVQLSNGSLYCVMRSYILGDSRHTSSLSNDLGQTWSEVRSVQEMFAFDSTPALTRYGNLTLAVWVNRRMLTFYDNVARMPLVLAFSQDNCKTWQNTTVIDSVYGMEINDLSFAVVKNQIVVAYRRYNYWYLYGGNLSDDSVIRVFGLLNADLNHDGTVDIFDALLFSNGLTNWNDIASFVRQYGRTGWFWSSEN